MHCEVLSKIVLTIMFIAVVIAEVYLSHQNGKDSGAASKSLSTRLHLSEAVIRTGVHIISFAVMMFLMLLVCKVYQVRMMTAVVIALWAIMDEVTKPMLKNERHCSVKDIGFMFITSLLTKVLPTNTISSLDGGGRFEKY